MKLRIVTAPWTTPSLTKEFQEAIEIIGDNIWKDSSIKFYAAREAKVQNGKTAPKGMQKFINELLDEKFAEAGWDGDSGYYYKNKTWLRITFRHQMSLGSDFINALKVCKKEDVQLAVIIAANRDTLRIISPNDAGAMISFDKLLNEMMTLDGVFDIPLMIGELTPLTKAPQGISNEILKDRPRDISVPSNSYVNLKNK
jgi:hypothetical protein